VKVVVRTYGGFAPALAPPAREVHSSELPPGEAQALCTLVAAVRPGPEAAPRPDERHYEVTIDSPGDARVLRCADSSMGDALAALLDFVERHGRRCRA